MAKLKDVIAERAAGNHNQKGIPRPSAAIVFISSECAAKSLPVTRIYV